MGTFTWRENEQWLSQPGGKGNGELLFKECRVPIREEEKGLEINIVMVV